MKSERGVTLTSLIIYIIAMVIVVGIVATLTSYFYGNLDDLTNRTESSKGYTEFTSYFTNDINANGNSILTNVSSQEKIVFSNGNQYTFLKQNPSDETGAIYMNKIQICKDVAHCSFTYEGENKVTVLMYISGKTYNNTYTLTNQN